MTRAGPRRNPRRAIVRLAFLVAFASYVGPSAANAWSASEPPSPPPPPGAFSVEASNGYSVFVLAVPAQRGEPAAIAVYVTKRQRAAIYALPAAVTETSIAADLGDLGEIAVSFQRSGQARRERLGCGDSVVVDSGHYEGTISFHGEESFADVDATYARGDLGVLGGVLCPGISGMSSGPGLPGAQLEVELKNGRHRVSFKVAKNRPRARAHFEVGLSEVRGPISIRRSVSGFVAPRAFQYDRLVQSATVRPPPPFSGSAQFHRFANLANRWTGNLTVDLPGRSNVKLTRRGMRSSLVRAHWDWG